MIRTWQRSLAVTAWLMAATTSGAAQAPAAAIAARAADGSAAMEAGRFGEAAAIYEELVKARPSDAGLLMNLGMARYMNGGAADALSPLQKALRLQPGLAPASLFLGAALLDLGRTEEALAPLQRAVKAMPENRDAREMLARASLELARHSDATSHYRALAAADPASPKAWYGLARSYEGLAEQAFNALQAQAPDSPLLPLLLADVLVAQGRYVDALSLYREGMKGPLPVGGLHHAVADLYARAGRPEWAAAELEKVRPATPVECKTRKAECEFLAGRVLQALTAARGSATPAGRYWTVRAANRLATEALAKLEALPPSTELHLIRAEIAQTRGRHTDAVGELRAALALSPGDPSVETALAQSLVLARNFTDALPLLERLVREHPDAAPLQFLHGDALLQSQQLEPAIRGLERAVALDPALVPARAALGRAHVLAGRYDAALPHLLAALAGDEDGSVHYQLGQAYQALGRAAEARQAMAEYRKRQPSQADAPDDAAAPPELTPPE